MAARSQPLDTRIIRYLEAGFASRRTLAMHFAVRASDVEVALAPAVESGEVIKETQITDSAKRRTVLGFRLASSPAIGSGKRRMRPCLCCGNDFLSAGPMNRLCTRCRTQDISPFAP